MKFFTLVILTAVIASCTITGNIVDETLHEEHFNNTVLFCGDCLEKLISYIENSETVECALYNTDERVVDAVGDKGTIITDSNSKIRGSNVIKRKSSGLMHNKFCVFDNSIVWTGSFNPTKRKALDNVIIINSTLLANNYLEEFEELKSNSSIKTTTTKIILNNTLIENYFCPEDCKSQLSSSSRYGTALFRITNLLSNANESIYFMAYSFTHPTIANELVIKKSEGIDIKGIIEKSTTGSQYSKHEMLVNNDVDVKLESTSKLLHHKVFIIDKEIVITGSMNPTKSGVGRNDENVLIIHDRDVGMEYLEQFEIYWNAS
ncbi:hypothetical protein CMO88_02900 [Candidatus Woesearchaeota archaeon]|nr:hypothetical protein [Candidatus Woesearchaeota archaeon]|tara:strand:+ start:6186 stop:7142 length:957 start_codon:yes stop_codon:yes gene_type:complete